MELTAVRTLDVLGSLKVPLRLMQKLGWDYGSTIEFFDNGNAITLRLSKEEIESFSCYLNKEKRDCAKCDFCENASNISRCIAASDILGGMLPP